MEIVNLRDEPHYLPQLAQWHHAQWHFLNPGQSLSDRIAKMQAYLAGTLLPSTLVGKVNGELVGSASLVSCDMDTHSELSPWLASVYVDKPWRCRGVGGELVEAVMALAHAGGYSEMYLFTDEQSRFYEKLGWRVWSQEVYRDTPVTIMHATLC